MSETVVCKRGHPRAEFGVQYRPNGRLGWYCGECLRLYREADKLARRERAEQRRAAAERQEPAP